MKGIRINRAKYIIPLIFIPFNAFMFYMMKDTFEKPQETIDLAQGVNEINTQIPSPNLDKRPLKNKFESVKEEFKYDRDISAIQEIDLEAEGENGLSFHEKELVDSINESIIHGTRKDFMTQVNERTHSRKSVPIKAKITMPNESEYNIQMKLFRDQMQYIDSLNKVSGPDEEVNKIETKNDTARNLAQPKIIQVSKSRNESSNFFNTTKPWKKKRNIHAVIDKDVKVFPGSRVRIRLLEDIFAGDKRVEAGGYLFGIVTAFKPQRIEITISSILVEGEITNVDIKVYDNDGLPGLYIPASQFREFTKELASNVSSGQNFQFDNSPDNQAEMIYGMAERAFSTTSRTVGKASKKNKARLKYNSILYLVNADDIK